MDDAVRKVSFSPECEKAFKNCKRKKPDIFTALQSKMERVIRVPFIGKPLRYSLKNRRRIHVGSFVLVYEFLNEELRFLDFDHHDKIYKKYR